MKIGNSTALPQRVFSRSKQLSTDRVSDTVMMGVTYDNPLLSSVHINREERYDRRSVTYHKEIGEDHVKEE